ncbi:hypothetical protein [Flagellimonas marinaquae]|uniref:hypothetical protein n=1 Tax=Flagellimonas marinaquae TaxID=254955 RepID=UPI002075DCB7|nr:hypothetical protein [Allomuricauda aquimarina]USD24758.1 hypothetical protein MJO53_13850 [Allomuricauda aquimarina]
MNKPLSIFIVIAILISCTIGKSVPQKIDFKSEYKFSTEIEDNVSKDTTSWKFQMSAADYAKKGDYRNALRHWDLAMGTVSKSYTKEQNDSINSIYQKVSAKEYIIKEAQKTHMVIINEAHHSSYHRFFTKSILKDLYDLGYKNLGLEALSNGEYLDTLLMERKYPVQNTGWYIVEPQFGNLVREALEIGYNVFAYEQTSDVNGKPREIEQAKNIYNEMSKHQDEKFLIHCGFDHSLEGVHGSWEKAMAGRLKEYTGINPLTINQVIYSEKSDPKLNNRLLKTIHPNEPTVLIDKENKPYPYTRGKAWSDIAIFHPNTKYLNGRPKWIFTNGNQKTEVNLTGLNITYPVFVMAFKRGENINNAVPMDIYEVLEKKSNCYLGLPKGDYVILVTNGKESYRFNQKVK